MYRWLKSDAKEYLEGIKLRELISKHAEYGASPIFLWTETTTKEALPPAPTPEAEENDDDEVKVEDAEPVVPVMIDVVRGEWERVNDRAPLWMREPKDVEETEYESFYKATFKDEVAPTSWTHFKVSPTLCRFDAVGMSY